MAALVAALEAMGMAGPETTEDALWDHHSRDAIAARLKDLAAEMLEKKAEDNPDEWALIERLVLLRTIDSVWVEHLTEVDELRQGIQLRAHAQEEPLNAFKKEAYGLFEEMSALIRHQVATTIFRVSIVRQPVPPQGTENTGATPPAEGAAGGSAGGPATGAPNASTGSRRGANAGEKPLPKPLPQGRPTSGAAGGDSAIRPGYSPAGVRMGRNDQCWCGSGRKYKKCHGA
jgi:preprotein translocase subunit SecA